MCIGLLVLCFSRSFWTGCTLASFLVCSVEWRHMVNTALSLRSAAQRFRGWCGHGRGPIFNVFVWRCWTNSAPILPWRLRSWPKFCMLLVPIHLLCLCMGVRGKWVTCEAPGIPHIWSPATEALPPAKCCIRVWEPGPVLNNGVRNKSFEGYRDSGLDGVLSCVAQGHHYEGLLQARPSRCGSEHCWGKVTGGVVPERDWPQRRWR